MADLYESLIGAAPTKKEQVAELAAALRRRRSFGELGMLTGDRVLSPVGQNLVKSADQYADQFQDTRQKDTDNAQTKAYQDAQMGQMSGVLKESMRSHDMSDATTRRGQDLALEAARLRAEAARLRATAGGKPPKFTVTDRHDLEQGATLVANMRGLKDTFKDDYGGVTMGGVTVPGARALANTLSANGLAPTKHAQAAQNWWAASSRLYDLFNRNKLFGATLTTNEMKAWAEANTNKNMNGAQIKSMLDQIINLGSKELKSKIEFFQSGGYNPDQIDAITQRAGEDPNDMSSMPADDTGPEMEAPLSDDEMAELQELRAKHKK